MKNAFIFLFYLFSLSASAQTNVCFNRLHQGYAEMLIPVQEWQDDSVQLKIYHPNNGLTTGAVYRTADLTRVTGSGGTEYYYLKGLQNIYGWETLTYEISSSQDAAVSGTLPALPQSQWNGAASAAVCGVAKANVCFNRLHQGYAEMLIPVQEWHDDSVRLKIYNSNGGVTTGAVYRTADLTRVTGSGGAEYYYLKGLQNISGGETLTYEVSSSQDAAVSGTLPALSESQWNSAATAAVCGVAKANVCFNRLHQGYAEMLIPVQEWHDDSVRLKIYNSNSGVTTGAVYRTADLTRVTGSGGAEYYYLKGLQNISGWETLTYEVSSSQDAAVSGTLPALSESQWNSAATAAVCGVAKANVCFNRLHQGYAEMLIPVQEWHDDSVRLKIYNSNSGVTTGAVYRTADLTRVTASGGAEYYYLKGLQNISGGETLTYEVSSSQDATVSGTLPALSESQWNSAATAAVCGVAKANVCFNRLHQGYAEMLIPVQEWHDDSVRLKIYNSNSGVTTGAVYRTADLTRVTASGGAEYYYLKGLQNISGGETLTYEVSSSQDATVSGTLPALSESQWNSAATAAVCGVAKANVCFNRLHQGYAEMLIPVQEWHDDSVRLKIYNSNSGVTTGAVYRTADLTRVTGSGGAEYYYLKGLQNISGGETLTYEVSSSQDAAVSGTLPALSESQWNDFALQNACIDKVQGICAERSNSAYTIYIPEAAWNDTAVQVRLYHSNGAVVYSHLFAAPVAVTYNGQAHYKISFSYSGYATEQLIAEVSSPVNAAVHTLLAPVQQLCYPTDTTTPPVVIDWMLAPNSYIFLPNQVNDGFYIPVKKAYKMWESDTRMGGAPIPSGVQSADVYWEDNHGLIRSGTNYSLQMTGTGENAKIKVPINKSKEGNAVIAFKVDGQIYWSWHVWVTDDPTNGSKYRSFDSVKRQRNDGTLEVIPSSDWGWMDRNLGAISSEITGDDWIRSGGLLYQWGRKDPIPPLMTKGNDSYEASGSVGRIRHRDARNWQNNAKVIDSFKKYVPLSEAKVLDNIRLSVRNPLSLIYINKNNDTGIALYNNNPNTPVNWFGTHPTLSAAKLPELNLWSDNGRGFINATNYNNDDGAKPYRNKSAFDPCPNGWRIPSMLVANLSSTSYADDVRLDFSPFGPKSNVPYNVFKDNNYHIIKPNDQNTPAYIKGIKLYRNIGMDLSNVGGYDMGLFPGSGTVARHYHGEEYTDQHETYLWTATMAKSFNPGIPAVSARQLRLTPDGGQLDTPSAALPTIRGRYYYFPAAGAVTSGAIGCRCIKDPLYKVNQYDFPTEFFNDVVEYTEGLYEPNTYTIVKDSVEKMLQIPIRKAFSAQSQLLNNTDILNSSNYNNLKVNVLWSTNTDLISNISISNPTPASLADISATKINIDITANQSGNAVVTLHNGSITNPIYWSWHIWVTNTPIGSVTYTTDVAMTEAPNYVNYVNNSEVLKTEFMDRNLGAIEMFPTITGNNLNPELQQGASQQIMLSGGLHYQWGRKDPIPTYRPAYDNDYKDANGVWHYYKSNAVKYYQGTVNVNGTVSYTALTEGTYNANYIIPYNTYSNASNANVLAGDKPSEKIAKVLSYSVRNPLAFMIPSTLAPVHKASIFNNGSDWLATEPNLAADRWGRGGKKSPFDPCPEGWRIPDFTSSDEALGVGVSVWFKKGIDNTTDHSTINDYLGVPVRVADTVIAGFTFNNGNYTIGNYPVFTGIRGARSVTGNSAPDYLTSDAGYAGIWSASLNSNYMGRAVDILFEINNSNPAKNIMHAYHNNNDPYFGKNCRCVKVKYMANGKEDGPVPTLPILTVTSGKAIGVIPPSVIRDGITQNRFEVFPNPVENLLNIKPDNEVNEYYYQIYNTIGQMVKEGKFENKQVNLSDLPAGTYLIRINNAESAVKIIKL